MITEQIMRQLQGGLLGGGQGGFPQPMPQQSPAGALPAMPNQMQGMGLGSPFFTNRPQQGLLNPQPGFVPSRWDAMSPNAMSMMGMNPNMPNLVGPTSALPPEMQPQASQLRMYGMEDQMAQPDPTTIAPNQQQQTSLFDGAIPGVYFDPNRIDRSFLQANSHLPYPLILSKWQAEANAYNRGDMGRIRGDYGDQGGGGD